jgi:hypothetical protein
MVHYERIEWTDDYPYKRLKAVHFSGTPANSLFLSGVLDLSVCDKLETLNCANNLLTGIRLSDTADEVLTTLNAHNNSMYLSALPLSGRTYGTQYISGSTVNYVDYQTGLDFSEEAIIEGVETTFELTNLLVENVDYTVQNGVLRFDPKLIGTSLGCAIRNTNFPNTMALYWFTVIDAAAGDTPILANMPQIYSRNGYVFIDNNNSRMVQIYDINGRMTVEGNSGKFAVPDGIYVVKTEGIVVKLIVND